MVLPGYDSLGTMYSREQMASVHKTYKCTFSLVTSQQSELFLSKGQTKLKEAFKTPWNHRSDLHTFIYDKMFCSHPPSSLFSGFPTLLVFHVQEIFFKCLGFHLNHKSEWTRGIRLQILVLTDKNISTGSNWNTLGFFPFKWQNRILLFFKPFRLVLWSDERVDGIPWKKLTA